MSYSRQAVPYIGINGVNVYGDLKDYITGITYKENASGATDNIDIQTHDVMQKWMENWKLDKNTEIELKIITENWWEEGDWDELDCGSFLVDSIDIKGFPVTCNIGALALPSNGTKNTKKWEKISVAKIAEDICKWLGCELKYYGDNIVIESISQSRQTDIEFLFRICSDYGLGMKVYRSTIIIFNRAEYDEADSVGTLHLRDIAESFTLKDDLCGTYTGARINYKVKDSDKTYTYTTGTGERLLILDQTCNSLKEAELKSKGNLYSENAGAITIKFTCMGGYRIYANTNYWIDQIGYYSGKYAIDTVTHDISKNGYTMTVEAHKVATEADYLAKSAGTDSQVLRGKDLKLSKVPIYSASTDKAKAGSITGTYYLYDGKKISGRYRITGSKGSVGKKPLETYVDGWIDSKYAE
jgi:phage protein D|nr:MAG TPA: tail protein [Caudoviricetes sp.]